MFTRTSMLVVGIVCPGHFRAMCLVSVSEKALTATIKDSPSQAIENNQRSKSQTIENHCFWELLTKPPPLPLIKAVCVNGYVSCNLDQSRQ